MDSVNQGTTRKKINPQKFAMWTAIGSIIMMFAGFTSGLIVRKAQGDWLAFALPNILYVSTIVILTSSLTMHLAIKAFKERKMRLHEKYVLITVGLGLIFAILQYFGFKEMFGTLPWNNNVALQYIVVIIGVHAVHVLGGVIALFVMFIQTFNRREKNYSVNKLEIVATYWHFVDILWIYLFLFFIITR